MPRIPVYEQQVQLTPLRAPAQQGAPEGMFTAAGEEQQRQGQGLLNVGIALGGIAEKEMDKANEARIHEKYSILSKAVTDSIYGDKGVTSLKGKDALLAADKWTGDFERLSGEVTKDLTPYQREAFERYRLLLKRSGYSSVLKHETEQIRLYEDTSFKSLITSARELVAADPTNTPMVNAQIAVSIDALRKRPEYSGASAEVRQELERNMRSAFHSDVVDTALRNKNVAFANEYFNQVKGDLSKDVRNALSAKIEPATEFEEGRALALDVDAQVKAGKMTVSEAERYVVSKAKTKGAQAVAQSVLREMQDADRRAAASARGSFIERFEMQPGRASVNAIMSDPGFQALPAEDRGNLLKYFRTELEQQDARARARRNEQYQRPEVFEEFMKTLDDPRFATMSREEIYALQPTLGPRLTSQLLAEQKSRKDATARFQLDKDIANEAIPKELLKSSNKDKLNAFRGIVESNLMEWKLRNPGKVPTLEEQKRIANSANTEWIAIGRIWNSDIAAYEAKGKENAVPKDFYDSAKSWAQKQGRSLNDADILEMWRRQQAQQKGKQ